MSTVIQRVVRRRRLLLPQTLRGVAASLDIANALDDAPTGATARDNNGSSGSDGGGPPSGNGSGIEGSSGGSNGAAPRPPAPLFGASGEPGGADRSDGGGNSREGGGGAPRVDAAGVDGEGCGGQDDLAVRQAAALQAALQRRDATEQAIRALEGRGIKATPVPPAIFAMLQAMQSGTFFSSGAALSGPASGAASHTASAPP